MDHGGGRARGGVGRAGPVERFGWGESVVGSHGSMSGMGGGRGAWVVGVEQTGEHALGPGGGRGAWVVGVEQTGGHALGPGRALDGAE